MVTLGNLAIAAWAGAGTYELLRWIHRQHKQDKPKPTFNKQTGENNARNES